MIDLELNSSTDLKREGKSFYWASFFLPKSSKKNAGILYSICRYFDDIADKHSQDQSNYLKNSIDEIKNNKNIARDVYEDSKIKRIYLPASWIPNISLKDLNNLNKFTSENDEKISNAIHKVITLSEKFYENGFAGLKYIPLSTRLGIFIAANVYRGIGVKIKSNKKKYLRERIYLNSLEKSFITIKSLFIFIFIP